ncbi:hypothetical protein HHK36_007002 [Tetracentron sinense]|uniref:Transcription initiation factor TFIID subunit 2 n=1 Tax=Tetracentron sinense TaxID=13715 RepID=A0A834ZLQ6_TETSI|nr:hypothetical protein HHK36_007002 [Tetracentron sinense]
MPFDLLGDDDNDDPSQLIAAQQQKVAPKKALAPTQATAQQPKQANLPSKPLIISSLNRLLSIGLIYSVEHCVWSIFKLISESRLNSFVVNSIAFEVQFQLVLISFVVNCGHTLYGPRYLDGGCIGGSDLEPFDSRDEKNHKTGSSDQDSNARARKRVLFLSEKKMAKPRKQKNEDQKSDNSGAVVRHQKLCLSIDMEKRRIYGYTELKISVPDSGIVGLHAENLTIESISVDGEAAEFEFLPHYRPAEDEKRWCSVSSASSAADAACSTYVSSLEREMRPNLLIMCSKSGKPVSDQEGQPNVGNGNGLQSSGESNNQNVKLVRIDYWVEKAETGIHFGNNVLHTDNQIRRAHCWFPCMDNNSQRCCYDLEITVAQNLVAVSNGSLLYQVLSKDDPPRKTYVYRLNVAVAPQWISLAVAPFEILPDRHSGLLSHMCLAPNLSKLRNTVGFFHSAFSHYEDYLSASFPFGSYKQVFVAPEIAISSLSLGASMSIFSSQVLYDEKVIDQTIDTRIKLAYALARQWFGVYITAEAPNDEWLLVGIAGFLTDLFIKRFLGNNEARYRRYKANCAVCKADVSGTTALSSSISVTDLYGTQCIGLYGKIRSWKSVAILQMLEKQMGPEYFRKGRFRLRILVRNFIIVIDGRDQLVVFWSINGTIKGDPITGIASEIRLGAGPINPFRLAPQAEAERSGTPQADPCLATARLNSKSLNLEVDVVANVADAAKFKSENRISNTAVIGSKMATKEFISSAFQFLSSMKVFPEKTWDLVGLQEPRNPIEVELLKKMQCGNEVHMYYFHDIGRFVGRCIFDDINAVKTDRKEGIASCDRFRHFANKVGNLERPFLKEFFPRWVGSCGCPVLRMGLSYNKRKNMIELAVLRGCTALPDSIARVPKSNPDSESREGDVGWPGMMSIRIHELDGMYDHPILPMAGETWQLLEIQCHSKLAARRIQKPKKGSKPDVSDDNVDVVPTLDMRSNVESPLLWLRADPEMEYLAEIHFNQPVQMWINQLEKDKDVVAQAQAISTLEALPQLSFSVVNALNNFLGDSKAFWRVRIEAAFALANTASEETDWAGLQHLVKFYKSRRFDANIGLPRPNDFHDFPEYFVLEAIPHAIAMVRAADKKSPREAVEFVLQLLKYNDNNGNPYSDVYWLAALVQSIGELEFGQQSILLLSSVLKRIDRLLQFDRLMPSYNGILTISCIRSLTQMALKLSASIPLDRVFELIKPFRNFETLWQVRIEASRALLDLEFHCKGVDAALLLFLKYLEEEMSLRGQVKLAVHAMRLCQIRYESEFDDNVKDPTLVALLCLFESRKAFNNVFLRHHLFCILQILAGRPPTLYGVPRIHLQPTGDAETCSEQNKVAALVKLRVSRPLEPLVDTPNFSLEALPIPEASKEADTISNGNERRMPIVKIRVKQSAASSRAEEAIDRSQGGQNETDRGASSSMSVDAPQRVTTEPVSISNQNIEEVNSCHDCGSRMTASIGSAKLANDGDEVGKELQCTADSTKVSALPQPEDRSSPSIIKGNDGETEVQKYASLQNLSVGRHDPDGALATAVPHSRSKKKEEKKEKEKKRKREGKEDHKGHRDDPAYLERKRLKKEKKQKEREMAKLQSREAKASSVELQNMKEEPIVKSVTGEFKPDESSGSKVVIKSVETRGEASEGSSVHKLRIKIKNRNLNKS